ncbi:hypothetical protein C0J52_25240 [Blattella germanica]|nr:hypothetical protein C0J52_25240 [Blattella germanica]
MSIVISQLFSAVALVMVDSTSNPGALRAKQPLLKWELTLDQTNKNASELLQQFLFSGDLTLGTKAIYFKKKCLMEGSMRERYTDFLELTPDNKTSVSEEYTYLTDTLNPKDILNEYHELVNIYTLAALLNITYNAVSLQCNVPKFNVNTCRGIAKKLESIMIDAGDIDFYEVMYLQLSQNRTNNNQSITNNDTTKLSKDTNTNLIEGEKVKTLLNAIYALVDLCQNYTYSDLIVNSNTSDANFKIDNTPNLQNVYIESAKLLHQMWQSYNISSSKKFPWPQYVNKLENLTIKSEENIKNYHEIFQYYVFPSVFIIVFTIGIVGNGTLLLIFLRHKEFRTVPNTMLMNLAVADTLNLLINTPVYYVVKYYCSLICGDQRICRLYMVFRAVNWLVIENSLLCLSAQRYFATVSVLKSRTRTSCKLSKNVRVILYFTTVWILSLLMTPPPVLVLEFKPGSCFPTAKQKEVAFAVDVIYCLFDALFLPILIGTFNTLTARLLRCSVQEMPKVTIRKHSREVYHLIQEPQQFLEYSDSTFPCLLYCAVALGMMDTTSNPGALRAKKLLLKWELTLNETNKLANDLLRRFLSSGDLKLGTKVIYLKKRYLMEGLMWERYTNLLDQPADNKTSEQYSYFIHPHYSKEMLNELIELLNVCTLATVLNITYDAVGSKPNMSTYNENTCRSFEKKLEFIQIDVSNIEFYEAIYLKMDKNWTEDNLTTTVNDISNISNKINNNLYECEKVKSLVNTLVDSCLNSTYHSNTNVVDFKINNSMDLQKFYIESAKLLTQLWKSYNISRTKNFPWPKYLDQLDELRNRKTGQNITNFNEIFEYYVFPSVFCLVFTIGIIGNSILLLIFVRHKEYRTVPNTILINLVIADTLNLLINTPAYYIFKYHCHSICSDHRICPIYLIFRSLNNYAIEISILCLSAQRYFATTFVLNTLTETSCKISKNVRAGLYTISVWVTALLMTSPAILVLEFKPGSCFPTTKHKDVAFAMDVVFCLFDAAFLPIIIGTFNTLTAKLLRRSVQEMPSIMANNPQFIARYKSARVVIALAVIFGICFIPRSIWFFIVSIFNLNIYKFPFILVDEITVYLMSLNSCLNPIALYFARICKISSKWPSIVGAVHNKDCVKYGYTRDNPYNETKQESCSNSSTEFDVRLTIQKYIFPSVFGVMLVVGLSGNGILLLIFIRDKASRTAPNALIFNLVVADIVHLVVNTPAYYVIKYYSPKIHLGNTGCEVYIACRIVNLAAMYVSVVATSAQRYFAIKSTLRPEECCCRLRTKFNVCIYILIVWLVAIGIGLPATLLFEFREYPCYPKVKDDQVKKSVNMAYIFCTTTAPPLLVIIFNTLTARLLRRSIRKTPGIVRNNAQEVSRYRCANIIIALTIAFCICYIPRNIWFFISSNFHLNPNGVKYAWEEEITLYFLISNSLQNPIALYIASTFFRERMKMYLFCRNSNRELRNL